MEDNLDKWEEEYEKCVKSIAYFYNNYVTINGELPKIKLTDEHFKKIIYERRRYSKIYWS